MTRTEAQKILGTMLMHHTFTDAELEALVMAGEALDDEWISVEDGLPEDSGFGLSDMVLCWYEYFRYGGYNCMYQDYGIGRYDHIHGKWCGEVTNRTDCKVFYWSHLPKMPEKEEENDG